MKGKIVIVNRPWQRILTLLLLSLSPAAGLGIWMLQNFHEELDKAAHALKAAQDLKTEKESLLSLQLGLQTQIQERDWQLATLKQGNMVERATILELQRELQEMTKEIHQIQRELRFYEGLMESPNTLRQMQIQGVLLRALETKRHYHYQLVLTNWDKGDASNEAEVRIIISGSLDGVVTNLPLSEIYVGEMPESIVKFRNFKRIPGNFVLPKGFLPVSIAASLRPVKKGKEKAKPIEWVFDWNASLK